MAENGVPSPPATAAHQVARLMDGYLTTQLLYVAAKLDIGAALASGPRSAEAIAATVGAAAAPLQRVLRGLAAEGVLAEVPDGHFALTPLGDCLRGDVSGSLRGAIIARGDLYFRAAGGLLDAVRTGGVPFEQTHGRPLFAYLDQHAELSTAFQGSMADRARQEAADVVAAYDFGALRQLIDVGGGTGVLLRAILAATPTLRAVLFDRPEVVARAKEQFDATEAAPRCAFVGGDFFAAVPAGGDAYLLSRVIHDWDDEAAVRILTTCHRAMVDGGRLLLVEAVLPERAQDSPAAIRMDLHMLLLLHGRERTGAEYEALLGAAGFRVTRIVPTRSPVGLAIVEAVRATAPATSATPVVD